MWGRPVGKGSSKQSMIGDRFWVGKIPELSGMIADWFPCCEAELSFPVRLENRDKNYIPQVADIEQLSLSTPWRIHS